MLELKEVKNHLQVDFDDNDTFIKLLIDGAYEYLEDTTGFDFKKSDSSKAKIFCLAIINECYENRGLTTEKAGKQMSYIMKDILIKLSYEAKKRGKEDAKA
ncbi:MAG: head-tail connector protein [Paraclostridium sordellii]|uniref:head-tail connector protein n=1 Tax=Paraclostridium sordellii TaxID=1505 RepID=UPI0005DAB1A7|nr:head-tail connector protein [Paeniclostridium sordellii]MDU1456225.1 head-tail connector protein [Paeniclostridium sordellii]CEN29825.1 putative DNA packaging protein [[Clostridium] sordellii] [Paeniclostridium sordellii]CEN30380.1 putative DNA packaging protein [[Clostridium] sordellii] [Paeniclostridium sordellii]CEP42623.1 putative DNA packaging protein [[Clostridium] sordellii] [Paeniclostridium sordellii]CEP42997.1 putative DNA packaging protein [[Clostridium] sordellii] [Paeniclostrid